MFLKEPQNNKKYLDVTNNLKKRSRSRSRLPALVFKHATNSQLLKFINMIKIAND